MTAALPNRLVVMVSDHEIDELESLRWALKLPSRSEVARAALAIGLASLRDEAIAAGVGSGALGETEPRPGDLPGKALPIVRSARNHDHSWAWMVHPWLQKAIEREQKGEFTEDDILTGSTKKPLHMLDASSRAALGIVMKDLGWKPHMDRTTGKGPVKVWRAP